MTDAILKRSTGFRPLSVPSCLFSNRRTHLPCRGEPTALDARDIGTCGRYTREAKNGCNN